MGSQSLTADQVAARFGPALERLWKDREWQITRTAPSITDGELLELVNDHRDVLHAIEEEQASFDEALRLEGEIDRTKPVSLEAGARSMKEAERASARIEEVSEALGNKEILRGLELITLRIRQRTKNA